MDFENLFRQTVQTKGQFTSLDAAEAFYKKHSYILAAIRNNKFERKHPGCFTPSFYLDGLHRKRPMYVITIAGFLILILELRARRASIMRMRLCNRYLDIRLNQH